MLLSGAENIQQQVANARKYLLGFLMESISLISEVVHEYCFTLLEEQKQCWSDF